MPSTAVPTILQDPGWLFWAPLATPLPGSGAGGVVANHKFTDEWPVAWKSLGATEEGTDLDFETKVEAVSVAEFFDPIKWATTERSGSFAFALADYTLMNLSRAFNGAAITTVSGTGATLLSKLTLPTPGNEVRAMIGFESWDRTLRAVAYQTIQGGTIATSFKRAPTKALIPCVFNFEVPAGGQPLEMWSAGTARLGV